ncbi:hypothetical protein CDV36_016417, partial [Fusarium kuroshium]
MLSPLKTRMSQSSANSGADQSESRDPDDGQTRNNNPETTATSHATKNKDEPLSAADRLIFSWRTNIEKPGGHHEIAEDDARNDSGLSERCEWTPLHELLQSTEQDHDGSRKLKTLLDQWKDIINVRSPEDEETALHMAVRGSFNKMASQLLTAGAQVDIENANGESPLHLACHYGDQHLVKSLLGADADPNKTAGGVGWSPLNKAIYYKRVDLVDTLLEGGSSLLIKDLDGRTPLMTAIKRCLYDVVQKLLEHLQKDSTELDAINIPDNIGMTPLMQLVTDKSGRSIANIEALLRMNPDINVTDEEGKTALHHVIASTYSIEIKPYMDVALKLVGSMSVKRLLHLDKDGETAFDVTFDEDKKASIPLFQPLLDSLAGRLVQEGESIQEPLCWAAYRLERHWIALDIFQKKFTAEVPQDLRQDQWEIVEWAIYARMPRVLLTYLRTLGLEKRVTKDDKINQSIENGRALIKKLKDEVRQSSTLLAEGKRRKGERGPTSGAGSSEDSQVLGDMEDILDYLYPEKVEKPTRPLELSKPDGRMTSSLNHFHAAIIQSNFVKFRTIQEVLYDDDSMKHIQDIAKKLKQFEYTINVSSEQASQTSDEFQANIKPSAQFTWIHLPSTNMAWMEDTAKKILKEEGCGKDEAERVTSFLRSSWIEVPDRTSTSRFMRPRYVVKKTQNATKKHAEDESGLKDVSERGSIHSQHDEERDMPSSDKDDKDHPGENRRDSFEGFARNPGRELKEEQNRDSHVSRAVQTAIAGRTKAEGSKSFAVSAIYMPYLYFSTYHQSESDDHTARDHMASKEGPSKDEKRVRDEIMIRQELFKAYEDSVIHQPATLDEFYYQFASDADSLRDQNSRNKDQVVTKYLQGRDFGKQRFWPLLRVSQLWVWTIDEKWLITSTSCAANDIRDNLVTDILEHLQKQVRNGSRQSGPTSATEMSRIIVDFCIGTYDKKRKRQNVNQNKDQRLQTGGTTTQDQHQ